MSNFEGNPEIHITKKTPLKSGNWFRYGPCGYLDGFNTVQKERVLSLAFNLFVACSKKMLCQTNTWLVVSIPLKNISQNGNLPQVGVKIKKIWNHHLEHKHVTHTGEAAWSEKKETVGRGNQSWCWKIVLVILRGFPLHNALFRLVIYNETLGW